MASLVVRDRWNRIVESVDVSGLSMKQIDKVEEGIISKLNGLGDFDERFNIELEG